MKYSLLNELQLSPSGRALKSKIAKGTKRGTFAEPLGNNEGLNFIKKCIKDNGIVYYSVSKATGMPTMLNVIFYVPYYNDKTKHPSYKDTKRIYNNYLRIQLSDSGTIRKLASGSSGGKTGQRIGRGNTILLSANKPLYDTKQENISDQFDIRHGETNDLGEPNDYPDALINPSATGYWKDYFTGDDLSKLNITDEDIEKIQSSLNAPSQIETNQTSEMYAGSSMQRNVGQLVQWGSEIIMIPKELAEQFRGLYSNLVEKGVSQGGFIDLTVKDTANYKRLVEALTYFNFACASNATKTRFKTFLEKKGAKILNEKTKPPVKVQVNNDFMNADMRRAGPFTEQLTSALLGIPNANDFAFQSNTPFVDISDKSSGFSVKFSHSSLAANRTKATTTPDPEVLDITNATRTGLISGISSIEYLENAIINPKNQTITIELNTNHIEFSVYLWNPTNPATDPNTIVDFANSAGEFTKASLAKGVSNKAIKLGVIRLNLPKSVTIPLIKDKNNNWVFGKNGNILTDIPKDQQQEMIGVILTKYKSILSKIKQFILEPTDKAEQEKRMVEVGRITRFLKVVNNMSINNSSSTKNDEEQGEKIKSIAESKYMLRNLLLESENIVNLGSWKIFLNDEFNNLFQQTQTNASETKSFDLPQTKIEASSPREKLQALSCLYFRLMIDNLSDSNKAPRAFDQTEDLAAFILGGKNINLDLPMANNFPFADVTAEWTSSKLFLSGKTAWSVKASSQTSPPTNYPVKDDFYLESLSEDIDNFGLLVMNSQNGQLRVRTYQIAKPNTPPNPNNPLKVGSQSTAVKQTTLIIDVPTLQECSTWFNIPEKELQKLGSPAVFKQEVNNLFASKQSLNVNMRTSSGAVNVTSTEAAQTLYNLLETNPSSKTVRAVVFLYNFLIKNLEDILTNSNNKYDDLKGLMDKIEKVYSSDIDGTGPTSVPNVELGNQPQQGLDILLPEHIRLRWQVLSGLK